MYGVTFQKTGTAVYKSQHYYLLMSDESMALLNAKALPFANFSNPRGSQNAAAAADCVHSSCRSADTQYADHRPAAHSAVCVDSRTQTLRTRKTSRRLDATQTVGRRPKRSQ